MFPNGWPGRGLLLLRIVAASILIHDGAVQLLTKSRWDANILQTLIIGAALLLLAGLWTPVSGLVIAVLEIWNSFASPEHLRSSILLATLGVALAMLGPGVRSIDARLFGRKRIEISPR
jgi:putative oxidoreductase